MTKLKHCRNKGARKFVYVGGGTRADAGVRRQKGFLDAVAGCECRILPGDFTMTAGHQAVEG